MTSTASRAILRTAATSLRTRTQLWGAERLCKTMAWCDCGSGSSRCFSSARVLGHQIATTEKVDYEEMKNEEEDDGLDVGAAGQSMGIASSDLLEAYRSLVARGLLRWDDEQVRVVMKLRHLLDDLYEYEPPLDLLARLSSSAPAAARRAALEMKNAGWWDTKGKRRASEIFGTTKAEQALVKVLSGEDEIANLKTPKGIMITGPPGTGKSRLLSLFFDLLPTKGKRRWHYHAFTLFLYRQVFVEMQRRKEEMPFEMPVENMERAAKKGWKSVFAGGRWEDGEDTEVNVEAYARTETIPFAIAKKMIMEYHILYFDEMQLVDASSAALLRDVLSWYWRLGGVIVTCSNRVPDDLYHHGVQRERLAGFLDSLKARCEVVELDGGRDWRGGIEGEVADGPRWFVNDPRGFHQAWIDQTNNEKVGPVGIGVYGRKVRVPMASGRSCRMTFAQLCEEPLGPADYITLASHFSRFFIGEVPVLYLRNKNEARRLINLIDALYEARCQLFISATVPVEGLFFPDAVSVPESKAEHVPTTASFDHGDTNESIMAAEALSETLHAAAHPNVSLYNPGERAARDKREESGSRGAGAFGVLGIWTGEDERFAYKRAVSRMVEMTTSPSYAREEWIPLSLDGKAWAMEAKSQTSGRSLPASVSSTRHGLEPRLTFDAAVNGATEELEQAEYPGPGLGPDAERADQSCQGSCHGRSAPKAKDKEKANANAKGRGDAPIIKEQHMWGVVDSWGKKAGRWGQGARVYKSPPPPSSPTPPSSSGPQ